MATSPNMARVFISHCLLIFTICSVIRKSSTAAVEASKGSISTNSSSRNGEPLHDRIIYPTEPQEDGPLNRGGVALDATPLPCPDEALFCESATDYPKDFIKNKLRKQPKVLLDVLYEEEIEPDINNKFGPDSVTEMELCSSTAKIVYPNKAQSKEGVFEFVVNDEEHKQGIRVETCTSNGGECAMMPAHNLPLHYKSSCVQKYILRTLIVLNRNSTSDVQGFVTKPFEFPSCCSCVIKMSVSGHEEHNRFGEDLDITPTNITARSTPRPVMGTSKTVN